MDIKKIGSFVVVIGIAVVVFMMRSQEREEDKKAAVESANNIIAQVEGFEANQSWYETWTPHAVDHAINASTTRERVGRRSRSVYDETMFLPHFFEKLIAMAQNDARSDIVKALIAVRDQNGIQRPGDIENG